MKLLIFFAFIGTISALQEHVEYQYHYKGQIASGIPAIRSQVSALGIRANLILQMKGKTQGLARLADIQIGEYHDDLQCVRLHQAIPFTYKSIPVHHRKILEEPFVVYFLEESDHVMDVPKLDVEFITNIRKSIVEMLRLEPILGNLGGIKGDQLSKYMSDGQVRKAFTVEEESILGRCESEYSIKLLGRHELQEEIEISKNNMKNDIQSKSSPRRRTSNIPKLEDRYYRLVRTINFNKCHDIVIQQHAGGANMSQEGDSLFRAVQSRSSVSTYILKGDPGSFRVERATVEGDVFINPFGFKTHRLQASTNQTLILENVGAIKKSMVLSPTLRPVKSWRYEVASPYSPSLGHKKQWVNYQDKGDKFYPVSILSATEIPPSSQDIQEYQETILRLLDEAVKELYSEPSVPSTDDPSPRMTKTSLATTRLYVMTRIMRLLPINNIRTIFTKTFETTDIHSQRKQMFLIDVAAASGASAPIKVLLDKMRNQDISPQRIASIFLTLPNNLYSPTVIHELMKYVESLDMDKNPLTTSSALINFASLAERVCISHRKSNYSIPYALFGGEDCGPAQILSDFLPFLEKKVKSTQKDYEKTIYLQAISNLGSPEIIPILRHFIHNKHKETPHVRAVAIYGLSRLRLPDSAREKVFDTLMAVLADKHDRSELRQAAFWTLVTWHPSASWWQQLARSTWRESSRDLATFIVLTVKSLARSTEPSLRHQSRIASFVLPLLKPLSPSLRSSYNRIYSRYDPKSEVGVNFNYANIKSDEGKNFQIYTSLRENFGDLFLQLFEVSVTSNKVDIPPLKEVMNLMKGFTDEGKHGLMYGRNPSDMKLIDSLSNLQSGITVCNITHADIYLRAFQNLYQYIPINEEVISKVAGGDGERILRDLIAGVRVNATKYLDPLNLEFFLPTEIGLPLRGLVSMPTVNLGEVDIKLVAPDLQNPTIRDLKNQKRLSLLFKSNYKYSSKLIVKLSALSPWNQKVAEVGVENYHEINLPFYGNLSISNSHEIRNVSLNVSPHTQQKFPILHQHNVPYTILRKAVTDQDLTNEEYKVIGVEKDRKPVLKVRKQFDKSYTGISSEVTYSGDAPYPFTSAYLLDYLRNPEQQGKLLTSPVSKQWQYSLSLDPSRSDSRNVTLALSIVSAQASIDENKEIPDFSIDDDPHQRLEKMKEISGGHNRIHGLNAQLFFNSTDSKKYEIVLALALEKEDSKRATLNKVYRLVAAALTSKVDDHIDGPRALCSDSHLSSPSIHDLDTLKEVVRSQPEKHYRSETYYGRSCRSEKIANAEGTLKLSEERAKLISEELNKVCEYDSRDPAYQLQTDAVYDIGNLDIEYSKDKIPRSILNASYSLQGLIEMALFPHGSYNNLYKGDSNKIRVEARRPLSSKKYTFDVSTPQKHSLFSEINVPYVATKIVPLTGLQTTDDKLTENLRVDIDPSFICYFRHDSIKTFDRIKYTYKPMACWGKLVVDHLNASDFQIRGRWDTNGVPQAQLTLPDGSIHVEVDYKKAVINGKEMSADENEVIVKDPSGRIIILVDRVDDGYQVRYLDKMTIYTFTDQIQIAPSRQLTSKQSKLRGLCGDYDQNWAYDKTGPKECIYINDGLFEFSWMTTEGEGCNVDEVETIQTQVKDYQQHCQHRPQNTVEKNEIYEFTGSDCMQLVYPVIPAEGGAENGWCASYDPRNMCKEGCKAKGIKGVKLRAGCWPKGEVPPDVQAGEEKEYNFKAPAEEAPKTEYMVGTEPKDCVKK